MNMLRQLRMQFGEFERESLYCKNSLKRFLQCYIYSSFSKMLTRLICILSKSELMSYFHCFISGSRTVFWGISNPVSATVLTSGPSGSVFVLKAFRGAEVTDASVDSQVKDMLVVVGPGKVLLPKCPENRCKRPSGATRRVSLNAKGMSEPHVEPSPKTAKTGRRTLTKEQSLSASPISSKLWGWSWEKSPEMGSYVCLLCFLLLSLTLYIHLLNFIIAQFKKKLSIARWVTRSRTFLYNVWQLLGGIPVTICSSFFLGTAFSELSVIN